MTTAQAEIYKWVDEQGNQHFTDAPPDGIKTEAVDLKINTYTAVEITPLLERLGRDDKVVIYTAAWCGVCTKAKQYFRDRNIPYVAYDVEKSPTGRVDFKSLRGKSVPILIVGNKRMNGFTAETFDKLYQQEMLEKSKPVPTPVPPG
ncbi:MAG TPA: glutaredoxin domain-containing protein [Gammaproteobacteria bacterium]|nr:glutaredoxin domain-containing protein [Gammaproteobacteria bacterium]